MNEYSPRGKTSQTLCIEHLHYPDSLSKIREVPAIPSAFYFFLFFSGINSCEAHLWLPVQQHKRTCEKIIVWCHSLT